MPHSDRTRDVLTALAKQIQALIGTATGTHTAVRIATLVPAGYVALK
jgi:hypothetical protein